MESVRPRRAAIAGGALVALFGFAVFCNRDVPEAVLAALGAPSGIARAGGLRAHYEPPPVGMRAAELEARLRARGAHYTRDATGFVVDIPGIGEDEAAQVVRTMTRGGLELRTVVSGDSMARIADIREQLRGSRAPEVVDGVTLEMDSWHPDDSAGARTDWYLLGPSPDDLDKALAKLRALGWEQPPHTIVALERVEPSPGARDQRPKFRTYLVGDERLLDGDSIDRATFMYDPNTHVPLVLLDFTREGGRRFGEITERIAGGKLATMLGGDVVSAPIINGPIRGGRASIAMGGSDMERAEHDARALVAVLNSVSLPAGGTVTNEQWIAPADLSSTIWLARALIGTALGLLAGLAIAGLVRFAKPWREPRPSSVAGELPWARICVLLLAPAAIEIGASLALPGSNTVELAHVVSRGGGSPGSFALGVTMLGLAPLFTAFALVEIVAVAVPMLRRLRHDPVGRAKLGRWVAVLALAVALAQGYFIARYLESLSRGGAEIVDAPGTRFELMTMATLAGATALLAWIAGVIRDRGVGNGYGALFAAGWLLSIMRMLTAGGMLDDEDLGDADGAWPPLSVLLLAASATALVAVTTRALLRWRVGAEGEAPLRVPTAGIVPLHTVASVGLLVSAAVALGLLALAERVFSVQRWFAGPVGWLAAVAVLGVAWSLAFARPAVSADVAVRAGLAPTGVDRFRRATVLSVAFAVGLGLAMLGVAAGGGQALELAGVTSVAVTTAVVLDIVDEARARRAPLVKVWPLHQAQHADLVAHALTNAGIPHCLHASHVRTLAAFFGPWAPIDVLVPEADAKQAHGILTELYAKTSLAKTFA